jgi:hypothetical protein
MKRNTLATIMNVYGLRDGLVYQFHDRYGSPRMSTNDVRTVARYISRAIDAGEKFKVTTDADLFGTPINVLVCTQEGAR